MNRKAKPKNLTEIVYTLRDLEFQMLDLQHNARDAEDFIEEARCFGYGAALNYAETLISDYLLEHETGEAND